MGTVRSLLIAAGLGLMPAQALAADWWWVEGEPGSDVVQFVDAESVVRDGETVTFLAARVARDDQTAQETRETLRCDSDEGDKALRRFACATDEQRMHFAAMLGPLTPLYAARAVFAASESAPPVSSDVVH